MGNLAVLEKPKHREKKEPKKRGPRGRGNVYRPWYKLADGTEREAATYWIRYSANGKRHYENSGSTKKQFAEKLLIDRTGKVL
jgi:hypothetical protein